MTFQQYALRWTYNNIVPPCKCGCGKETSWNVASKGYAEFVLGHHAWGRQKTDEEKRKIGDKNRENMKRFMSENPDIAKERGKILRSSWTVEREQKRIQSCREAYQMMSTEAKEKFSEHSKRLWQRNDRLMFHAVKKSVATFKQRFAEGKYDFIERNQQISRTITQKYIDGTFNFKHGKHTSPKTGLVSTFRSSWEEILMQQLDADSNVMSWKSEGFSIPYELDGKTHRYIPDLLVEYVDGHREFIEVKPHELRNYPKNAAKREAAKKWCVENGIAYTEWAPTDKLS